MYWAILAAAIATIRPTAASGTALTVPALATFIPAARRACARPSPMPLAPPVTKATRPEISSMADLLTRGS